ncbi:unnamed protein product [Leuciscus chuanchicus]
MHTYKNAVSLSIDEKSCRLQEYICFFSRNRLCLCNNASSSLHLFSLACTNLFNTHSITRKEKNKPISSYQLPGLYNGFLDDCLPDCKSTAGVPQASFTPGTRHPQPCLV